MEFYPKEKLSLLFFLFIHLFISVWTQSFIFILWVIVCVILLCSNCPRFRQRSPFMLVPVSFCHASITFFQPFLAFRHHKIFQAHVVHFLSHPWHQSFLQNFSRRNSGSFYWRVVVRNQDLDVKCAYWYWGIIASQPLCGYSYEIYACVFTPYICVFLSVCMWKTEFPVVLSIYNKASVGSSPWNRWFGVLEWSLVVIVFSNTSECFNFLFLMGKSISVSTKFYLSYLTTYLLQTNHQHLNTGPQHPRPPNTHTHRSSLTFWLKFSSVIVSWGREKWIPPPPHFKHISLWCLSSFHCLS